MESSKNIVITGIVLAVVIGGLVYAILNVGKTDDTLYVAPNDTKTPADTSAYSLIVTDQPPGDVVFISSATLPEGGFVVIYKDDSGSLGISIGSRYFRDGTNPGDIQLTEPLVLGGKYYAVLHRDNGNRTFEPAVDVAVTRDTGEVVSVAFMVVDTLPDLKL